MKNVLIFAALTLLGAGCAGPDVGFRSEVEAVIEHWSTPSALAARRFLEEYGMPDEIHSDRLIWRDNGPWKRTVVWDATPPYVAEGEALDVMEQTVDYSLTQTQADAVRAFSDHVKADKARGELSARSGSEELDCLALNLADDVIQGRLSPGAARHNYDKILELEASGKSSPYLSGLMFSYGR